VHSFGDKYLQSFSTAIVLVKKLRQMFREFNHNSFDENKLFKHRYESKLLEIQIKSDGFEDRTKFVA
jgi:hypothetical protein